MTRLSREEIESIKTVGIKDDWKLTPKEITALADMALESLDMRDKVLEEVLNAMPQEISVEEFREDASDWKIGHDTGITDCRVAVERLKSNPPSKG